jgi:transcription antitermination factor NusG
MKAFIIVMAITFGMYVKVTAGFYKGCTGIVTEYYEPSQEYSVNLTCTMDNGRVESKTATLKGSQIQQVR